MTDSSPDGDLSRPNGSLDGSNSNNSGRSTPCHCTGVNGLLGRSLTSDTKLFVGGLSWMTTPEKLKEYFSQFGPVQDALVMKDPITQRSRGFGFITFSEAVSVARVLAENNHNLDGKKIDPKQATPREKTASSKTKKVFVGGVSQDTTLEEVQTYFSQFGKVDEAVMLMDQQTKRHRGFGFVTFEVDDVVERICAMHYHTIKGKKVECKRAQPKDNSASLNVLAKRMVLTGSPLTAHAQGSLGSLAIPPLAAAAAVANFSKLMGSHSSTSVLGNYRYSPYTVPTINSTAHGAPLATLAYGYQPLPTLIDVSSLPSVDWSNVYNAF